MRQTELIQFLKNLSMLGGALLITQVGAGPWGGPCKYGDEAKLNFRVKVSELFKEYLVKFSPIVNRVVVLGDTAYDYGGHEFILTPKSGGPPIRKR